ncbi:MAG: D-alanyl-D-alanine carboxypeptidase/D-alanyl-D-alanine-endopeptidase [Terriglobia bacterium]
MAERIQRIISRPEVRHALFGIEFYSLDTHQVIYQLNGDKLFTPASTTKLLTMGTALELLGADYRYHTRVYGTGAMEKGTLKGDLVLVASGDPNLSGRIQPDGTLAFENEDHAYGGSPDTRAVTGDPLQVIRELARQVFSHGVRRIEGRVLVDASLFPEGEAELGTGAVISPIVVNDNVVDVTASPAATVGDPVRLQISPATAYVKFTNDARTGAADSKPEINWTNDVRNPDGSHSVTVTGNMPVGKPSILYAYMVQGPSRFAEVVFAQALAEAGVTVATGKPAAEPDFKAPAAYTPEHQLAEHISPPMAEEVKVTLKVSQNLHASIMPYMLGAVLAHAQSDGKLKNQNRLPSGEFPVSSVAQAGFSLEHDFLEKAGLDLSSASQGDGAGGAHAGCYTPDFMVHYLEYMSGQKDFAVFFRALPILGRDGTLWNIQVHSRAAENVRAKTGTWSDDNALDRDLMVTAKGLAGYITNTAGKRWAFAAYVNHVAVPDNEQAVTEIVGQLMGEIAAAGYETLEGQQ